MRHPARVIAAAVGIVVVAFAIVLATQVGGDPQIDAKTSRLLGGRVPSFSVETLSGEPLTSADLEGRAVIVNFWNSWCIPCEQELPALKEFHAGHVDDPEFLMVGIVRDDTERAVRADVAAEDIDWTIGLDPDAKASLAFGTRGQPETFAISADGQVRAYNFGPSSVADLELMLRQAQRD